MVDMKRVCPDAPATAPDLATAQGPLGRGVSDDILKQASRRLSITALLMSATYVVAWSLGRATWAQVFPGTVIRGQLVSADWISIASIVLSLGLFFYARKADRDPQLLLDIGLAYQVAAPFGPRLVEKPSLSSEPNP